MGSGMLHCISSQSYAVHEASKHTSQRGSSVCAGKVLNLPSVIWFPTSFDVDVASIVKACIPPAPVLQPATMQNAVTSQAGYALLCVALHGLPVCLTVFAA